jgi:hypothetical protein
VRNEYSSGPKLSVENKHFGFVLPKSVMQLIIAGRIYATYRGTEMSRVIAAARPSQCVR